MAWFQLAQRSQHDNELDGSAAQADSLCQLLDEAAARYDAYDADKDWDERIDTALPSVAANGRPYCLEPVVSLLPGRKGKPFPIVFQSRDEGLHQIRAGFLDQVEEHTWLFVPAISAWIDHTYDFVLDSEVQYASVKADFHVATTLLEHFGCIESFHTHPRPLTLQLNKSAEEELEETLALLAAALPGQMDLIAAGLLEDLTGVGVRHVGHVISLHGVFSYERSDEFRKPDACCGPLEWDAHSMNPAGIAFEEIQKICRHLQEEVMVMPLPDGSTTPGWYFGFTPWR